MADNKWKNFLLKSGLPLEFEVKNALKELDCWNQTEFSYLRKDEKGLLNEFSYDIDSELIVGKHKFELMIECKYRHESTNWLFLPEEHNESDRGIGTTDFMNTNDFFCSHDYNKFIIEILNFFKVAPLCSKGIEITSDGQNPKSISQAISQLSYGLINKVVIAMKKQLDSDDEYDHKIYHHIPIIFTTANLRRLKENQSIEKIKNANSLDEISTNEDIILVEPKVSLELQNYSLEKLNIFTEEYKKDYLDSRLHKRYDNETRNFDYHKKWISQEFPKGILVIKHSKNNSGLVKLIDVLNEIANPSEATKSNLNKLLSEMRKDIEKLKL